MFLGINTEQNDLEESERKYSGWKVVRSLSIMGSQRKFANCVCSNANFTMSISNRSEVFCKKVVLKNFAKKTPVPEACNFIKKETLAQLFSCKFCEIFESIFLYRTLPVAAPATMRC